MGGGEEKMKRGKKIRKREGKKKLSKLSLLMTYMRF